VKAHPKASKETEGFDQREPLWVSKVAAEEGSWVEKAGQRSEVVDLKTFFEEYIWGRRHCAWETFADSVLRWP